MLDHHSCYGPGRCDDGQGKVVCTKASRSGNRCVGSQEGHLSISGLSKLRTFQYSIVSPLNFDAPVMHIAGICLGVVLHNTCLK
jgi:hypothetical protein